jgi:hypothetical protein
MKNKCQKCQSVKFLNYGNGTFTCEKCGKETDEVTLDCICLDCDNIYSVEKGVKKYGK